MIKINLLPVKAARKHGSAKQELALAGIGIFVVVLGLYAWHLSTTSKINDMNERIQSVNQEIARLKQDVVRVEEFKQKNQTLESKIKVIEDLQKSRIGPAKLMDDVATILNTQEKVWLKKFTEADGSLVMEGSAMEHENISEFQLALERDSKLIKDVKLVNVTTVPGKGTKVLDWKITCKVDYRAAG